MNQHAFIILLIHFAVVCNSKTCVPGSKATVRLSFILAGIVNVAVQLAGIVTS